MVMKTRVKHNNHVTMSGLTKVNEVKKEKKKKKENRGKKEED